VSLLIDFESSKIILVYCTHQKLWLLCSYCTWGPPCPVGLVQRFLNWGVQRICKEGANDLVIVFVKWT